MKVQYQRSGGDLPHMRVEISVLDLLALLFGKVYDLPGIIVRRRGWLG